MLAIEETESLAHFSVFYLHKQSSVLMYELYYVKLRASKVMEMQKK